jgi:hypothetical protein
LFIKTLQVEEGFLDGLELEFVPGLNVLIGPRGTGKTSAIELMRFCLEVPGFTDRSNRRARQHALSVLGSGRVTVTLDVGGEIVTVTRTAEEDSLAIHGAASFDSPTILSQNEIEQVGLDAKGRLRIIDGFRSGRTRLEADERSIRSSIHSLTVEMQSLASDIDGIEEQIRELQLVPHQLKEAEAQEAELLKTAEGMKAEQQQLTKISRQLAAASVRSAVFERSSTALTTWKSRVQNLLTASPTIEDWPQSAESTDPLSEVRSLAETAASHLSQGVAAIDRALEVLQTLLSENRTEELSKQEEARRLRRQLDELQEGAGATTRKVATLREKAGQLSALKELLSTRKNRLRDLQRARGEALDELDSLRESRFEQRLEIAGALNAELHPFIDVSIERYGYHPEYASAIAAALRGSGLHYNTLAPLLAQRMSPRELVEAIESNDGVTIANLGEMAEDRAERAIGHMRSNGLGEILTAPLEDDVKLRLLDGPDYKSSDQLSTGQRCTVVLPILLGHRGQVLIVDQPEDHLDNAFIVDTVIQALLKRQDDGQIIFATHNANIPVLGDARVVTLLGSDGRRGFKRHSGSLGDQQVVRAITSVMEGGLEAFKRRAEFYGERLPAADG